MKAIFPSKRRHFVLSRNSGILALVAGSSLLFTWFILLADNARSVVDLNVISQRNPNPQTKRDSSPIFDDPLPCARVTDDVRFSRVFPAQKLLARKTITSPPFWISSHEKDYDIGRWNIINDGIYYEKILTQVSSDTLCDKAPGYVIDVGANVGWLSLVAASFGHKVLAFEPNPANQMRLCQSILLNDWEDRIDLFPIGVSDVSGTMTLKWNDGPGAAMLTSTQDSDLNNKRAVRVDVQTLDEIAASEGLFDAQTPIYFLKVDVESFEPQVFRGAARLLKSGLVRTILHEISVDVGPDGHKALRSMFRQLLEANYVPRGMSKWNQFKDSELMPIAAKSATASEDELQQIINACMHVGPCDIVWDHNSLVQASDA
jgi:FkbM family methyltransferase